MLNVLLPGTLDTGRNFSTGIRQIPVIEPDSGLLIVWLLDLIISKGDLTNIT
jgi:hypothetical protein